MEAKGGQVRSNDQAVEAKGDRHKGVGGGCGKRGDCPLLRQMPISPNYHLSQDVQ